MSIQGYSKCRIQFIPDDRRGERNYSDKSLIELRQYDFNDYSLRALDIANNREEIFNFPFKEHGRYKFGNSIAQPDEVRSNNGTYRLWLHEDSRDQFYDVLRSIKLAEQSAMDSDRNSDSEDENEDINTGGDSDDAFDTAPDPTIVSPKDILLDVHRLSKYIEQGDANAAARLASQLASKGVRLQAKSLDRARNEEEFTVHVQFDGNDYGIEQQGAKIPVEVYQSTTVRELRAAFELAYHYPPPSQYFFVNGCLAHDNSTMKDLNVGPNSLFVLFLLTHIKKFKTNGPWVCRGCNRTNQQNNLRCVTCSALRTE